jgi:hypothetical protein
MKQPEGHPHFSPNWAWPEKTWFRQRLNAVKAREQEEQRKPASSRPSPATVESETNGNTPADKDEPGADL